MPPFWEIVLTVRQWDLTEAIAGIVSEMGIVKLFTAGLPLRIAMVGTLTGLQWCALAILESLAF